MPYLVHYRFNGGYGQFPCKTNHWSEISSTLKRLGSEKHDGEDLLVISISPYNTDPPPTTAPRDSTEFRVTNITTGAVHRFDYRSEADSFYDASVAEHGEIYGYELSTLVKRHDPPEMLGVTP